MLAVSDSHAFVMPVDGAVYRFAAPSTHGSGISMTKLVKKAFLCSTHDVPEVPEHNFCSHKFSHQSRWVFDMSMSP